MINNLIFKYFVPEKLKISREKEKGPNIPNKTAEMHNIELVNIPLRIFYRLLQRSISLEIIELPEL